jgi:hypothetical protein
MSIILFMHEQMLNDPWPNVTTLFTNIECIIRMNKKGHKNVHFWFQRTWLKIYVFSINSDRAKENKTVIFPLAFGHHSLLLWLHLPKFSKLFLSLELRWSWCYWYNFWTELFNIQAFQACSILVAIASDLGLGGCHLAFLMLAVAHNLLGRGPHVDHHLPSPPFWLQLLVTYLVVVILILVVWVLHLLCLHFLQLLITLLVTVFMSIIVFLFFPLDCSC